MAQTHTVKAPASLGAIKALTFLMFMMFAMTTDSVGIIIPEIIKQFNLSMTAASAFQYATMGGIAQFYDRDMTKEMADEGMKGMQQFISDPSKLDSILAQLEATRKRIYKK